MKSNKGAFIDRDGVINHDYGYVHKIKDFNFCKGVFEALRDLVKLDFKIIIITNQSGIARGIFTEKQYKLLNNFMLETLKAENINIEATYHCPHHPNYSLPPLNNCECRKPKPGLFKKALQEHNLSPYDSIAIGDNERDLIAAKLSGISKRFYINNDLSDIPRNSLYDFRFKSLLECTKYLRNKR